VIGIGIRARLHLPTDGQRHVTPTNELRRGGAASITPHQTGGRTAVRIKGEGGVYT
jgi:hypothetical protein